MKKMGESATMKTKKEIRKDIFGYDDVELNEEDYISIMRMWYVDLQSAVANKDSEGRIWALSGLYRDACNNFMKFKQNEKPATEK
jgi:hypothetical protein